MRFLLSLSVIGATLALAACSIHPVPENFSRATTSAIVQKVRCEARQALVDHLLGEMDRSIDEPTRRISNDLRHGRMSFAKFNPAVTEPSVSAQVEKFRRAALAYNFIFKISESNDASGGASFDLPFTGGIFTIGIKAGAEKDRTNERSVKLADTFEKLVVDLEESCAAHTPHGPNFAYPITGDIGLSETIGTFIRIANAEQVANVSEYYDELTFVTKLFGEIKPSVKISKIVPKKLFLKNADATFAADRIDSHKLRVVFTDTRVEPPPKDDRRRIKLAEGVILEVPMPKAPNGAKVGTGRRRTPVSEFVPLAGPNFSPGLALPPRDRQAIEEKALDALDRSLFFSRQQRLRELTD